MEKKRLPLGFLTTHGEPTMNSIIMYVVYLTNLPVGWNHHIIYDKAVQSVREHFKTDFGFDVMIKWGIYHGCCKSKTSSDRHSALSKAYILAQSIIGSGVRMSA